MKWLLACILCGWPGWVYGQTHQEKAVAAVIMAEAWSEGETGMTAVAEVIHQRAVEKGWTPWRVISAQGAGIHAFSCLNGTTPDHLVQKFSHKSDFQSALRLARMVCESPEKLPGITQSANHFTRATESPYWAQGEHPVVVIGRHAFYRLKNY